MNDTLTNEIIQRRACESRSSNLLLQVSTYIAL